MHDLIFIGALALVLGLFYAWAFRHLPRERWQILCAVPLRKEPDGRWQAVNLTYYGLFNAGAVLFGLGMVVILLGSVGLSMGSIGLFTGAILMLCVPSAKWMARLVEKKKHTLSIGGAAFCGLMLVPPALGMLQPFVARWTDAPLPVLSMMAAMIIGYAFGEGSGRLACLSFGCCYGRPVSSLPPVLRRWCTPLSVVFHGPTKKAAYADGLGGRPLVAVQAITAVIYTVAGLAGLALFLHGWFRAAYLLCLLTTQLWRVFSEFLRADFRGGQKISRYQYFAAIAALAGVVYSLVLLDRPAVADLAQGVKLLGHPAFLLGWVAVGLIIFFYTGRSQVTGAHLSLYVHPDRI
jgi:hypothetical protein